MDIKVITLNLAGYNDWLKWFRLNSLLPYYINIKISSLIGNLFFNVFFKKYMFETWKIKIYIYIYIGPNKGVWVELLLLDFPCTKGMGSKQASMWQIVVVGSQKAPYNHHGWMGGWGPLWGVRKALQYNIRFHFRFLFEFSILFFFRILVVNNLVCRVILSHVQFLGLKT